MIIRLKELNSLKYKIISLTKEENSIGKYLNIKKLFNLINGKGYNLAQVEHFIDSVSIKNNIEKTVL